MKTLSLGQSEEWEASSWTSPCSEVARNPQLADRWCGRSWRTIHERLLLHADVRAGMRRSRRVGYPCASPRPSSCAVHSSVIRIAESSQTRKHELIEPMLDGSWTTPAALSIAHNQQPNPGPQWSTSARRPAQTVRRRARPKRTPLPLTHSYVPTVTPLASAGRACRRHRGLLLPNQNYLSRRTISCRSVEFHWTW